MTQAPLTIPIRTNRQSKKTIRARLWIGIALVTPILAFLVLAYVFPMVTLLGTSFDHEGGPFQNYVEFISNPAYMAILWRTIGSSIGIALLCALVGYPFAYLVSRAGRSMRVILLGMVLISFWTAATVKTFSWVVVFQRNGLLDQIVQFFGGEGLVLRGTVLGVTIAMAQVMLPFMIYPLVSSMASIDRRLPLAAQSLGASPATAFWKTYFPLSIPGLVTGFVLVFIISLGFYIVPSLVGSPSEQLLSQLVFVLANSALNFGQASTGSVLMLLLSLIVLVLAWRSLNLEASPTGGVGGTQEIVGGRKPIFLGVWATLVTLWLILPTLVLIPLSFSGSNSLVFPPKSWSLRWYEQFFTDERWYGSLLTSAQIAVVVAIVATIIALLAAYGMTRTPLGRTAFGAMVQSLVLSPRLVPGVVSGLGLLGVYLSLRWTGTFWGYVVAHVVLALPFVFIPVMTALRAVDTRLEDAAAGLGASPLVTFFTVTLPAIAPGAAVGVLFALTISFDETIVSSMIGSNRLETLPVRMFKALTTDINPTVAVVATLLFTATVIVLIAGYTVVRRMEKKS